MYDSVLLPWQCVQGLRFFSDRFGSESPNQNSLQAMKLDYMF